MLGLVDRDLWEKHYLTDVKTGLHQLGELVDAVDLGANGADDGGL